MGNSANVYASKARFESMIAISFGGRVFDFNFSFFSIEFKELD